MADFGVNRQFPNTTLKLRNPANTFDTTFINPTITQAYNAEFMDTFDYLVHKSGSNYVAKRDNWSLESSNSDPNVPLAYAITNAERKGAIGMKGGSSNEYLFTSKINLIDKNVSIFGISNNSSSDTTSTTDAQHRGGVVWRKNYATAEPFVDLTNTVYAKTMLKNIAIIGNNTSGDHGIKAHDVRERQPFLDNVSIDGFDTGLEISKAVYCDISNISIAHCLTNGLLLTNTALYNNTLNFYGGRIIANPTDIKVNASSANDIKFFGTRVEGASTGYTNGVNIGNGSNNICFYGCSFEKNQQTTPVVILDDGNNNTYFNCRFDSDVSYTPIHLTSGARNINIIGCWFQTNTSSTVSTILIDAGAVGTNLISNTKGTNTVGTVTLTDNGTLTTRLGNSQMGINDKVPSGLEIGASGNRFIEIGSTVLGLRDSSGVSYRSLSCNAIGAANLRTTGQIDVMTIATGLMTNTVPMRFDDYHDLKAITIPADPSSGYIRLYPKATDANTDSLYMKAKMQGAVSEFKFFP